MSKRGCDLPLNVLFDLDGTLLDSLPGIRYSAEAAFRACGLKMGAVELKSLIGPPIRVILQQMAAKGVTAEEVDGLERSFRWSYDTQGWRMTPHYDGAAQALQRLRAYGRRLFVVSNKPRHISMKILEGEGTLKLFEEVVTRDSREPPYAGKPEMMQHLMKKWDFPASDSLMVGDTMEDAEAARHTSMPFCLMTHGYGDVPEGSGVPVAFRFECFAAMMGELPSD